METPDYGVCRLSVVPVRAAASDKSEQVTQLLFGDHYEVVGYSPYNKWLKVKSNFDQYEGWIDAHQHHSITPDYFKYLNKAEFKITTDITSSLLYNKSPLMILMGSMIPISSSELFKMEEQFAFNGEAKNLGQKREFEFLKNISLKYLNAPYMWGGKNPFGIDCSGFVQMVFKICGYRLFRDCSQQAHQGKYVQTVSESKPGDLVFLKNEDDRVSHVGIYLGDGRIIHAAGRVRIDHISEEGILHAETKAVTHRFSHLRRILAD